LVNHSSNLTYRRNYKKDYPPSLGDETISTGLKSSGAIPKNRLYPFRGVPGKHLLLFRGEIYNPVTIIGNFSLPIEIRFRENVTQKKNAIR
jgi:hypothetical protein